jgi:hypothetical protein
LIGTVPFLDADRRNPDFQAASLLEAATWILTEQQPGQRREKETALPDVAQFLKGEKP